MGKHSHQPSAYREETPVSILLCMVVTSLGKLR